MAHRGASLETKSEADIEQDLLAAQAELAKMQSDTELLGKSKIEILNSLEVERRQAESILDEFKKAADREMEELQSKINLSKKEEENLQISLEKTTGTLTELESKFTLTKTKFESLCAENSEIESKNRSLTASQEILIKDINDKKSTAEVLAPKLDGLLSEIEIKSSELNSIKANVSELEAKFGEIEDLHNAGLLACNSLEVKKKELEIQIQGLETRLTELSTQITSAKSDLLKINLNKESSLKTVSDREAALLILEKNVDKKIEDLKRQSIVDDANVLANEKGLT